MALSQIKCLDENNVNLRTHESKPEFLYSEEQRLALETLLRDGSEAFTKFLQVSGLRCFLSDQEVDSLTGAVQVYDPGSQLLQADSDSDDLPLSLQYWPDMSDFSLPRLDLGWPDCAAYRGVTRVTVYTQPPLDGFVHIKEVVRKSIGQAQKLIAVVMDQFTDVDIFRDLLEAGFKRKVCVYILLERTALPHFLSMAERSAMHPGHLKNLRVRVTGGTEFLSRSCTRVRGRLGHRFLFIDGDKAVSGSYSFTWTASRLDRHLVTMVTGQAVDSFDRLFRDLYLTSSEVDLRRVAVEKEPVPEPLPPAPPVAQLSAVDARKLFSPKYALMTGHATAREASLASSRQNTSQNCLKTKERVSEPVQDPPLHLGLACLEKAYLIPYLPTWPEPDPPSDVIGFINVRDPSRPTQVHLQRSERFETSQAIRFSSPVTRPTVELPPDLGAKPPSNTPPHTAACLNSHSPRRSVSILGPQSPAEDKPALSQLTPPRSQLTPPPTPPPTPPYTSTVSSSFHPQVVPPNLPIPKPRTVQFMVSDRRGWDLCGVRVVTRTEWAAPAPHGVGCESTARPQSGREMGEVPRIRSACTVTVGELTGHNQPPPEECVSTPQPQKDHVKGLETKTQPLLCEGNPGVRETRTEEYFETAEQTPGGFEGVKGANTPGRQAHTHDRVRSTHSPKLRTPPPVREVCPVSPPSGDSNASVASEEYYECCDSLLAEPGCNLLANGLPWAPEKNQSRTITDTTASHATATDSTDRTPPAVSMDREETHSYQTHEMHLPRDSSKLEQETNSLLAQAINVAKNSLLPQKANNRLKEANNQFTQEKLQYGNLSSKELQECDRQLTFGPRRAHEPITSQTNYGPTVERDDDAEKAGTFNPGYALPKMSPGAEHTKLVRPAETLYTSPGPRYRETELQSEDMEQPGLEQGPAELLREKPANKPTDRLTDKPAESQSDIPAKRQSDIPAKRQSDIAENGPAWRTKEKPADRLAERPAKFLADSPVERPAESITEIPAESLKERPAERPPETPAESLKKRPPDTPAKILKERPVDSLTETPAESQPETPAETPVSSSPKSGDKLRMNRDTGRRKLSTPPQRRPGAVGEGRRYGASPQSLDKASAGLGGGTPAKLPASSLPARKKQAETTPLVAQGRSRTHNQSNTPLRTPTQSHSPSHTEPNPSNRSHTVKMSQAPILTEHQVLNCHQLQLHTKTSPAQLPQPCGARKSPGSGSPGQGDSGRAPFGLSFARLQQLRSRKERINRTPPTKKTSTTQGDSAQGTF
ncbi:uncharacterized protein LOC105030341 isoform X2 [Esox lucius]|uniref:uncharacterized protein LOC105030341 isoform X2 n=1 Tax=Esox lucius TaxID=8010 RepID=UPI001476DA07|nr:uncharacterized protein LOC105030341 isoform X2 [Esox lucius]